MTQIDLTPIEETHRNLVQEIARLEADNASMAELCRKMLENNDALRKEICALRDVNEAQAEQLRKAQERIRLEMGARGHPDALKSTTQGSR